MSSTEIDHMETWTENILTGEIAEYRANSDDSGLENFLLARIEDNDPCCVSFRPQFWNEYGLLQIIQEEIEEAVNCFQRALAIDPANITALYNLGTLNMQLGRLAAAQECFTSVLISSPHHFKALFNIGLCHLYDERKEEALSNFLRAADLQPDHSHLRYLIGEIFIQQDEADKALVHLRAAFKENPNHYETTMGLAIALLKTGNYERTISICDQALLVFGAATLPLQIKGDAMLALGGFEEAVTCHIDLCNLDLDIRDFVITRLTKLAEEDPASFTAYTEVVHTVFPSFEPILKKVLKH